MKGDMILLFLVFFPIIGAFITYLFGRYQKDVRDNFAILIVVIEFIGFAFLFIRFGMSNMVKDFIWNDFCGMGLHFSLDGFRVLYGLVAAFMWMMTIIFSKEYFLRHKNRNRYYLFNLLTLGATVGVFLSADLYTTFIFFEMMSFTSYVWVAQDEKKESLRAAGTYLAIAVIGGLVMLMGLFLLYDAIGTLEITKIRQACEGYSEKGRLAIAGYCLFFGFAAKAGIFPLHVWLPKAHPVAPAPASALLSGILTKSGIYGILIISCNIFLYHVTWGFMILFFGVITMFGGAMLAVFSTNLKRILACSSMSQIGFILVGIGMQCLLGAKNEMAIRGSILHMVNHSLLKLVLFMSAGVVVMNTHKLDLNEIRGFGRKKPFLNFVFLMGALGISGIPLWNGYISKTLIHESIVEYLYELKSENISSLSNLIQGIEWVFLLSGAFTIAYMAKIYIALFVEENVDPKVQKQFEKRNYIKVQSKIALLISAILLPIFGLFPDFTLKKLADMSQEFISLPKPQTAEIYYTIENLKGSLISIVLGIVCYFVFVRLLLMGRRNGKRVIYLDVWPGWFDIEELIYRPVILKVIPFACRFISRIFDSMIEYFILLLRKTIYKDRKIPCELLEGTRFTHLLGTILNTIYFITHKGQKRKGNCSYVHISAVKREEIRENIMIIERSMSFGLFMFCLGLCITLIYLLFLN